MGKKDVVLDTVEVVAKTAVSLIPVGGALATAIYDTVKNNTLAKRKQRWMDTLEERISKLEENIDAIGRNPLFATALIKTTEVAMKTPIDAKLEYLANAVASSLNPKLEEEKLMIFMDLLDKYTISHIKIINFFHNPSRFEGVSCNNSYMGTPMSLLFQVHPELDNDLFNKIYKDLYTDGLVNTESLRINMSGSGMVQKRTTELGDDFLKFILGKN